jgi:hypothetical protein
LSWERELSRKLVHRNNRANLASGKILGAGQDNMDFLPRDLIEFNQDIPERNKKLLGLYRQLADI